MRLYIVSEAQKLEGACDGAESLAAYAKAFATLDEAEEALRGDDFMREVVMVEYDEAPEVDFDEIIDEILKTKQTVDDVTHYYREATERIATLLVQVFEFSLQTAKRTPEYEVAQVFEVIAMSADSPVKVRSFTVGDYAEKLLRLPKTRREALMIFNESLHAVDWCRFLVRETIEQAVFFRSTWATASATSTI